MPNHWHLVLWPRQDRDLSRFMGWLTLTHTQRWHAHRGTGGTGHVYQARFKSFPVQADEHFLTVCRYVERNALRAKLVKRAADWRWCSLWRRAHGDEEAKGLRRQSRHSTIDCTTCRVEFIAGDPERMTVAEKQVLAARGLTGVRLSCQILADHDMTVRAISRFAGSGRKDAGNRSEDTIHPQPVEWTTK